MNVIKSRYGQLLTPYDQTVIDAYVQMTAEANAALLQQVLDRILSIAYCAMQSPPVRHEPFWEGFKRGVTFGLYDPDRR